jgi:hypothetical protein
VREERCAEILERLAAGDVVVVMVAVDHVPDWRRSDFLDLVDVGGDGVRAVQPDRVGRDDALGRDHEHRLMATETEDVDVVGPVDLGGGEWRGSRRWRGRRCGWRGCWCGRLLCLRRGEGRDQSGRQQCNTNARHGLPP